MKRKEILRLLEERLARGEISEKTYLEIKARYEAEPEEPETPSEPSIAAAVHEAVSRAMEEASRAAAEAPRAAVEAMRAVEFSGLGVRLSDEAIRIVGSGVVSGNPVKTVDFRAAGGARVHGNLECETARVAGSCDFSGDVHCAEFRSSGSARVAGSLRAQEVEASGSLEVAKDIEAVDLVASGSLRVDGNVHGHDFHSSGSVQIGGELKAVDIDIELGGSSRVKSVEGQDIRVRRSWGLLRTRGELTAERIVGQDVDLEGTVASYVRGQDVRIGPHCRIDVVEAQELLVHESSEVRERRVPGEPVGRPESRE